MDRYNPDQAPEAGAWNSLDEGERILLARQYHKRKGIRLPNANLHAVFHVIVENQIAMGAEMNVSRTLDRLIADGLDRHDALHAIASVLAEHMHGMLSGSPTEFRPDAYASDLDALTVETWRQSGEDGA